MVALRLNDRRKYRCGVGIKSLGWGTITCYLGNVRTKFHIILDVK
jgi:hypothetical protein